MNAFYGWMICVLSFSFYNAWCFYLCYSCNLLLCLKFLPSHIYHSRFYEFLTICLYIFPHFIYSNMILRNQSSIIWELVTGYDDFFLITSYCIAPAPLFLEWSTWYKLFFRLTSLHIHLCIDLFITGGLLFAEFMSYSFWMSCARLRLMTQKCCVLSTVGQRQDTGSSPQPPGTDWSMCLLWTRYISTLLPSLSSHTLLQLILFACVSLPGFCPINYRFYQ